MGQVRTKTEAEIREDAVRNKMDNIIEQAIRATGYDSEIHVIYSAYESDEDGVPINNLAEIAIKGKCVVIDHPDEFWGGQSAQLYVSPVLENPTWLDLCVCSNQSILKTNDHHHVFLEAVNLNKTKKLREQLGVAEDVAVYEFAMGS